MNVLNLYAGLGGNRKNWTNVQVTAVEHDPRIAAIYQRLHPDDQVIVGDARAYLEANFERFEDGLIWTSHPCQRDSRMAAYTRHKSARRCPSLGHYQEIIFLKKYCKGHWVAEQPVSFYDVLIEPTVKMGRHHFWATFPITPIDLPSPPNFINLCNLKGKAALMDWLGIHYPENIYYGKNHCPAQILRNCVHPVLGAHILEAARAAMPAHQLAMSA